MDKEPANGCYRIGEGNVLVWNEVPALLSVNEAIADKYRNWIRKDLRWADITGICAIICR